VGHIQFQEEHMQLSRIALAAAFAMGALALTAPSIAAASADGVTDIISTKLKGSEEVPGPGDGNGRGEFSAVLSGDTMCYAIYAKRIAPATAAHIHDGDFGVAGPVIITLQVPTKSGVSACVTAVPDDQNTTVLMSESELAALKSAPGGFYVNVHNATFPAGAIRGQL
jgi:hypothetical protein